MKKKAQKTNFKVQTNKSKKKKKYSIGEKKKKNSKKFDHLQTKRLCRFDFLLFFPA